MKLWRFNEFSRFFEELGGTVLELDEGTARHMDWRHARMRVAVCDPHSLPYVAWVKYVDPFGEVSRYEVDIEVEKGVWNNNPSPLHLHLGLVGEVKDRGETTNLDPLQEEVLEVQTIALVIGESHPLRVQIEIMIWVRVKNSCKLMRVALHQRQPPKLLRQEGPVASSSPNIAQFNPRRKRTLPQNLVLLSQYSNKLAEMSTFNFLLTA